MPIHLQRFSQKLRKSVALGLCFFFPLSLAWSQESDITPIRPSAPFLWRPYLAPEVPAIRVGNSNRLRGLVRAGKLYLSAQDAIALALENNVDIEVARYNPISLAWRVERAEAGGALPGVPSGATQTSSVTNGQGVLGSQAAAGVSFNGSNGISRNTGNATISQIGPVTQTLDPSIQEATTFSHRSLPQPNNVQSITPILIQNQRIYTGSYQQGFLSGGSVKVDYNNRYLSENAPTDVLNPSVAPTLAISVQQSLLQGFGSAVGGRTITVAKINLRNSDLNFKSTVIGVVVEVLNAYNSLVADYEDVKSKTSAMETSRTFVEDSQRQVRIGSMAEVDLISARSQVATAEQNLVNSNATLQQRELTLKNLISRIGTADPLIASAKIVPTDRIAIPESDDLPPVPELVKQALANRTDLAAERANITTSEVSARGTRSGVLPNLQVFAGTSNAGLAGTPRTVVSRDGVETADPYFVGGVGTALGQIFRRNFPTENAGAFLSVPLFNRQAQADYGIDQLQLRQTQLTTEKDFKQAQVDVLNSVVALRQARVRYEAATKTRILAEQLLDAEQRKFKLGSSTPYNITQQQRDLVAAQSTELSALVSYTSARVSLDQTTGNILEAHHVSIAEAHGGVVSR